MTGDVTTPKKLKYNGIVLFLIQLQSGPLLHFLDTSKLILDLGSVSETFLGPTYVDNQLWFGKHSPNYLFSIR